MVHFNMSGKSIILSILSAILFLGFIVVEIFLFRNQFILGFIGLLLFIIPIRLNAKANEESNGLVDKLIARFAVPVAILIGIIFIVLAFTLWF